jgi:hypothetical protein
MCLNSKTFIMIELSVQYRLKVWQGRIKWSTWDDPKLKPRLRIKPTLLCFLWCVLVTIAQKFVDICSLYVAKSHWTSTCQDTKCYMFQSVSITWTFILASAWYWEGLKDLYVYLGLSSDLGIHEGEKRGGTTGHKRYYIPKWRHSTMQ